MSRHEIIKSIPERPVDRMETERIAVERREALRTSLEKAERDHELSSRDKEEKLTALKNEAVDVAKETPKQNSHEVSLAKRRSHVISKHDRDISFKKHMDVVQEELPSLERRFSKFIHNKTIESLSDSLGATLARPNALLFASAAAFFFTLITYIFAKYVGFRLSGFEMIGAFILGWIIGLAYDYVRLMIRGGKQQ